VESESLEKGGTPKSNISSTEILRVW